MTVVPIKEDVQKLLREIHANGGSKEIEIPVGKGQWFIAVKEMGYIEYNPTAGFGAKIEVFITQKGINYIDD